MDHAFHRELLFFFFENIAFSSRVSPEQNAERAALRDTVIRNLTGAHKLVVDLMALYKPEASASLIENVQADYGQFLAEMPLPITNTDFMVKAGAIVDRLYRNQ